MRPTGMEPHPPLQDKLSRVLAEREELARALDNTTDEMADLNRRLIEAAECESKLREEGAFVRRQLFHERR
jgi:hypothetical protein